MAKSRKSQRRAASRRANRSASRKNRRNTRRQRRQSGGSGPVGVYDLGSMSDRQGADFASKHVAQHGGAAPIDAPTRLIEDPSLLQSARTDVLDAALKAIEGIRDPGQAGGRRRGRKASRKNRKASRKNRKASRKNRKASRKNRKASRKNRRQSGGRFDAELLGSASGPHMLLSPAMTARAGLNADWSNLSDYVPKLR